MLKGLYRKISVILLLAMVLSVLGPAGVFALDEGVAASEPVAQVVESVTQTAPSPQPTVVETVKTPEPTPTPSQPEVPLEATGDDGGTTGAVQPEYSTESAPTVPTETPTTQPSTPTEQTTPTSQPNTPVEPVAPAQELEAPAASAASSVQPTDENGTEATTTSGSEQRLQTVSFYDQLVEKKTCKEIYEMLCDDANYDQAMSLTVEQVNALVNQVQNLADDGTKEMLLEALNGLLEALGATVDGENSISALHMEHNDHQGNHRPGEDDENDNDSESQSSVDHIDLDVRLKASVYVDGKLEEVDMTLEASDAANITIVNSKGGSFTPSVTGTSEDTSGNPQIRFSGTFPVGTETDPITYTVTLKKNTTVAKENVAVTFSASFSYYDGDNVCPGMGRQRGMDFKLGAGNVTNPKDDNYVKDTDGAILIQKVVKGLTPSEEKPVEVSFLVTDQDEKQVAAPVAKLTQGTQAAITVDNLPVGQYTVTEVDAEVEGYDLSTTYLELADGKSPVSEKVTVSVEENETAKIAVVNTYTAKEETPEIEPGQTVDIYGEKTWVDQDNKAGKRPESITVVLLADGEKVDSCVVTEEDDWAYGFEELPKYAQNQEIVYSITEEPVAGYQSRVNGYDLINTYQPEENKQDDKKDDIDSNDQEKIDLISGTKTWKDHENQDGIRPEQITVNLLADGEKVASQTVTAANGWTYQFKELAKYASGKEIVYTVEEEPVSGYTSHVDGYNITNTHEPEKLAGGISGRKIWNDGDNQDGIRPEKITVNLLADGKKVASQTVGADEGWAYQFESLDKYASGKEIVYTVEEDAVPGYTTQVNGYNIINTHEPEVTRITVEKKWIDRNDLEEKRPDSITVQLYANGKAYGEAVSLTETAGWKCVFEDLPKYQNGEPVTYSVKETSVKYYVAKYASQNGTLTITNTFVDIPLTGDSIHLIFWTMMVLGAGGLLGGVTFHTLRKRS